MLSWAGINPELSHHPDSDAEEEQGQGIELWDWPEGDSFYWGATAKVWFWEEKDAIPASPCCWAAELPAKAH